MGAVGGVRPGHSRAGGPLQAHRLNLTERRVYCDLKPGEQIRNNGVVVSRVEGDITSAIRRQCSRSTPRFPSRPTSSLKALRLIMPV